jgi:hypothetical protein
MATNSKKKTVPLCFRQGDVLLMKVDDSSAVGVEVPRDDGRLILASGEVTGHHHAIASRDAHLFEMPTAKDDARALKMGERILKTFKPVALEHEEHAPVRLPAGTFVVKIQKTYQRGSIRSVAD